MYVAWRLVLSGMRVKMAGSMRLCWWHMSGHLYMSGSVTHRITWVLKVHQLTAFPYHKFYGSHKAIATASLDWSHYPNGRENGCFRCKKSSVSIVMLSVHVLELMLSHAPFAFASMQILSIGCNHLFNKKCMCSYKWIWMRGNTREAPKSGAK